MPTHDPRVDAYIENAAPFARPILERLRAIVHEASPAIEETLKWGMPYFTHKGILCGMAAFEQHCAFGFWKDSLLFEDVEQSKEGMGSFGRITKVADMPPRKELLTYIRAAVKLNEDGVKRRSAGKSAARAPSDLTAALKKHSKARAAFAALSPSQQREYIEWLIGAKKNVTRARRLATAIEWIIGGKSRQRQYAKSAKTH